MNDTIGENDLQLLRLVLVVISRFPIQNSELRDRKKRLAAVKMAQAEMSYIVAKIKVAEVLSKNESSVADRVFWQREHILIYSEAKNA